MKSPVAVLEINGARETPVEDLSRRAIQRSRRSCRPL